MSASKNYWISAFNEGDKFRIRYHPEVGCGEYYAGGLDMDNVKVLAESVYTELQKLLHIPLTEADVFPCPYDGIVAEYYVDYNDIDWDILTIDLEELDPELSDLCIDYVEFN